MTEPTVQATGRVSCGYVLGIALHNERGEPLCSLCLHKSVVLGLEAERFLPLPEWRPRYVDHN